MPNRTSKVAIEPRFAVKSQPNLMGPDDPQGASGKDERWATPLRRTDSDALLSPYDQTELTTRYLENKGTLEQLKNIEKEMKDSFIDAQRNIRGENTSLYEELQTTKIRLAQIGAVHKAEVQKLERLVSKRSKEKDMAEATLIRNRLEWDDQWKDQNRLIEGLTAKNHDQKGQLEYLEQRYSGELTKHSDQKEKLLDVIRNKDDKFDALTRENETLKSNIRDLRRELQTTNETRSVKEKYEKQQNLIASELDKIIQQIKQKSNSFKGQQSNTPIGESECEDEKMKKLEARLAKLDEKHTTLTKLYDQRDILLFLSGNQPQTRRAGQRLEQEIAHIQNIKDFCTRHALQNLKEQADELAETRSLLQNMAAEGKLQEQSKAKLQDVVQSTTEIQQLRVQASADEIQGKYAVIIEEQRMHIDSIQKTAIKKLQEIIGSAPDVKKGTVQIVKDVDPRKDIPSGSVDDAVQKPMTWKKAVSIMNQMRSVECTASIFAASFTAVESDGSYAATFTTLSHEAQDIKDILEEALNNADLSPSQQIDDLKKELQRLNDLEQVRKTFIDNLEIQLREARADKQNALQENIDLRQEYQEIVKQLRKEKEFNDLCSRVKTELSNSAESYKQQWCEVKNGSYTIKPTIRLKCGDKEEDQRRGIKPQSNKSKKEAVKAMNKLRSVSHTAQFFKSINNNTDFTTTMQQIISQVSKIVDALDEKVTECELSAEKELNAKDKLNAENEQKLANLKNELEAAHLNLTQQDRDSDRLRKELADLQGQLQIATQNSEAAAAELTTLKAERKQQVDTLTEELSGFKTTNSNLEETNSSLAKDLSGLKELETTNAVYEGYIEKIRQARIAVQNEFQANLRIIEKDRKTFKGEQDSNNEFITQEQAVNAMHTIVGIIDSERNIRTVLESLRTQLVNTEEWDRIKTKANRLKEALTNAITEQRHRTDRKQQILISENKRLEKELNVSANQESTTEQQLTNMQDRIKKLLSEKQDIGIKKDEEIADLKLQMGNLTSEIERIERELSASAEQLKQLSELKKEHEMETRKHSSQVLRLMNANDDLFNELDGKSRELEKNAELNQSYEQDLKTLEDRLSKMDEDRKQLEQSLSNQLRVQAQQRSASEAVLEKRAKDAEESSEAYKDHVGDLEVQLAGSRQSLDRNEEDMSELNEQLTQKTGECKSLTTELHKSKVDSEAKVRELNRKIFEGRNAQRAAVKAERQTMQEELKEFKEIKIYKIEDSIKVKFTRMIDKAVLEMDTESMSIFKSSILEAQNTYRKQDTPRPDLHRACGLMISIEMSNKIIQKAKLTLQDALCPYKDTVKDVYAGTNKFGTVGDQIAEANTIQHCLQKKLNDMDTRIQSKLKHFEHLISGCEKTKAQLQVDLDKCKADLTRHEQIARKAEKPKKVEQPAREVQKESKRASSWLPQKGQKKMVPELRGLW